MIFDGDVVFYHNLVWGRVATRYLGNEDKLNKNKSDWREIDWPEFVGKPCFSITLEISQNETLQGRELRQVPQKALGGAVIGLIASALAERYGIKPWPETLCCVLEQDTLLSQKTPRQVTQQFTYQPTHVLWLNFGKLVRFLHPSIPYSCHH